MAQPVIASAVFRTLARWGRSGHPSAGDFIQDIFLKLCAGDYRILRSFRGSDGAALRAYLRVIAASVVTDRLRAEDRSTVPLDDPENAPVAPDDRPRREIERNLMLDSVEKCLDGQKDRDRRVFWLYHRHGYTPKSIAALPWTDLGQGGVEMLVYRLTKAVADCMKKGGYFRAHSEGGRA